MRLAMLILFQEAGNCLGKAGVLRGNAMAGKNITPPEPQSRLCFALTGSSHETITFSETFLSFFGMKHWFI